MGHGEDGSSCHQQHFRRCGEQLQAPTEGEPLAPMEAKTVAQSRWPTEGEPWAGSSCPWLGRYPTEMPMSSGTKPLIPMGANRGPPENLDNRLMAEEEPMMMQP